MTPSYALVYTCYGWDAFIQSQYDRNVSRCRLGNVHVVADETRGPLNIPGSVVKTSANKQVVERLGLRTAYARSLFWHNLDYLYYVFFDAYPDYEYYVFLDYDAVIDADIDDFITSVHAATLDHVGEPVLEDLSDWVYAKQHAAIYGEKLEKGAILAVTVLSRRALSHLFNRRAELSQSLPEGYFWPFCEAFLTNELKAGGFRRAPLSQFGSVERFAWWPPTLEEALEASPAPSFVHPVLDKTRYISSMVKHSPGMQLLSPSSRLWQAARRYPDKRWMRLTARELLTRVLRMVRLQLFPRNARNPTSLNWT